MSSKKQVYKKKILAIFILMVLFNIAVPPFQVKADSIDYNINVFGGRTLPQGGSLPLVFQNDLISGTPGTDDTVDLQFIDQASGNPLQSSGTGLDFICPDQYPGSNNSCMGSYPNYTMYGIFPKYGSGWLNITASATTTPGIHTIIIKGTSHIEGVVRTVSIDVNVVSPAQMAISKTSFPPPVAIPQKAQWESDMTKFGTSWCDPNKLDFIDQSILYYDGTRVYYNIADYTHDPKWNQCARFTADAYTNYVNGLGGNLQSYRVFTQGLHMDYDRIGTAASKQVVTLLDHGTNSWYADPSHISGPEPMREAAYALDARLDSSELSGTSNPLMKDEVNAMLGQFDQIFIQKQYSYFVQPFMVGLAMNSLIRYYNEKEQDPRIPYIIKQTLDTMWAQAWKPEDHGFAYRCYMDGCYTPNDGSSYPPTGTRTYDNGDANLNNLISPAYAWMFLQTGDPKYREQADNLFANGALYNASYWKGKEFSQNYRWSFDYVKYREQANALGVSSLSDIQAPTVSVVLPKSGSQSAKMHVIADASDNVYIAAVQFKIDGVNAGSSVITRPFETDIQTELYSNGSHNLTAVAYDTSGNSTESAPIVITINNSVNAPLEQCASQSIPVGSFKGCYYNHGVTNYAAEMYNSSIYPPPNLGTYVTTTNDSVINFDWGGSKSPIPGLPNTFFGVVWEGKYNFDNGIYTFTVNRDTLTGIKIFIDGQMDYDGWWPPNSVPTTFTVNSIVPSQHDVRVELWRSYTNTGDSIFYPFSVSWAKTGTLGFNNAPPPDTTPPILSLIASSALTQTTATISWTTDENSDTQVDYGTTTSYGSSTTLNTTLALTHTVSLSSLAAGTLYHVRVKSKDASGNIATSGDQTFTTTSSVTDTTPPILSLIASSALTQTTAAITWTTDKNADSQIEYGLTTAYGQSTSLDTILTSLHTVTISGLLSNTTYHYRVKSTDGSSNLSTSSEHTFVTLAIVVSSGGGGGGGSSDYTPPIVPVIVPVVPVVTPPIIPPSLPVVPPLPPPSVPTGTTFLTPVTVHSNGVYIETLQAFLNATVPHTNLVVDGTFGHLTIIAIKTFQALHGLTADGIMGKKTREVMNTVAGK
jgi:hypothetical protein